MANSARASFIAILLSVMCLVAPAQAAESDAPDQANPGWGWGMMGGYGYGMGPGMMGGYGAGPLSALNLTDDQRNKINKIIDTEQKQHWAVMGKMLDEQNKLRDLYEQSAPDPKKVGAAYGAIAKLRQQMLETHVQASNDIQKVLTKEQREQLEQWRRGPWGPHGGYGPGMRRP